MLRSAVPHFPEKTVQSRGTLDDADESDEPLEVVPRGRVERARAASRLSQAERRDTSRTKLLKAAYDLIAERGFRGTSFQAIAERAGYSPSLVSARFGSRDGLLGELVRQMVKRWTKTVRNPAVEARTGIAGLRATAEAHRQALDQSPAATRAMYMLMFESIIEAPELRREFAKMDERLREATERLLQADEGAGSELLGGDVHAQATLFLALLRGITLQWMIDPDALDLERIYGALDELLERGLR
jgi:AcrR family transcriptional regulator